MPSFLATLSSLLRSNFSFIVASFFVGFRPLAGLPFKQEKFVSNQNILPSVHQVIESQSSAADGWACAWAGAAVQMS